MHKELLVFSWLNGQVQFVHTSRGNPPAIWDCPKQVDLENPQELATTIAEGVERTHYRGKNLAIVIELEQLTQQLMETPPAKGRDLDLFIDRQIDQLKIFPEKAAWSYHVAHPTRGSSSVMLYILPLEIRSRLIAAAQECGLHLLVLVVPSVLLAPLIADLPIGEHEAALLGMEIHGTTTLIAGSKSGGLFLTRSLCYGWERDPERVASQINRSTVFVRQQFGVDVSRVHLLGRGATEAAAAMQNKVGLPISAEAQRPETADLPLLAAGFPPKTSANLITREQQRAPQRRLQMIISSIILSLLTVVALAVSLGVELKLHRANRLLADLQPKLAELQMKKADLEKQFSALDRQVQLISFIETQQLAPIPAMFLSYLGDNFPDPLILTKYHVMRHDRFSLKKKEPTSERWMVRLEGSVSWHATDDGDSATVQEAFRSLEEELATGPFRLLITDKTKRFSPRRYKPSWSQNTKDQAEQFFIEGYLGEGQPEK